MHSADDALGQWDIDADDGVPADRLAAIFTGTAMLNRLLSRQGLEVGAIVTAGQEDYLRIERGDPDLPRLLATATACTSPPTTTTQPLVPRERIHGVRGRDRPLRRGGPAAARAGRARRGRRAARRRGRGDRHLPALQLPQRRRTSCASARSSREVKAAARRRRRASRSSSPPSSTRSRRDLPRLNSTVIEAYAAEPSRGDAAQRSASARASTAPASSCASWPRTAARSRSRPSELAHDAGLRADRRRRRRRSGSPSGSACRTCSAPTSAAPRFDIALITDGRLRGHADARHRALRAQHAAGARSTRSAPARGSFVRVEPELATAPSSGPTRPAPRIGVVLARGRRSRRSRSPTSTSCSGG